MSLLLLFSQAQHLKYGSATLRVTTSGGYDDQSITIDAPSGRKYVDLTSTNTGDAQYLTALSSLASGDQVEASSVVGGDIANLTLNADGTYTCTDSATSFSVRAWRASTGRWESTVSQSIVPEFQTITTTGLASEETFGSSTVTNATPQSVTPTGLASEEALGSATVANVAAQSITATGIASDEAFGTASIANTTSDHLKYGTATLRATIDGDDADISITIVAPSGRAYVNLTSTNTGSIYYLTALSGLTSGDQVEASNVVGGSISDVTLNADGTYTAASGVTDFDVRVWRASTKQWESTVTQNVAREITPSGVSSGEVFGATVVANATPQSVNLTGVDTAEAFGSSALANAAAQSVTPSGVGSGEAIGSATVANATPQSAAPSGVDTAEAFGTAEVLSQGDAVTPSGIGSDEAFGTAVVALTVESVTATGVPSDEALGSATIANATPQSAAPSGVDTAAAFGTTIVARVSAQGIGPADIISGEAFGTTTVTGTNVDHLKYGPATLKVDLGTDEPTISITIVPPSGRAYVDVVTPHSDPTERLTTSPDDIESGDQIEYGNVVGGSISDVTVNDDGTWDADEGVVSFDFRVWDGDTATWGSWATQTVVMDVVATGISSAEAFGTAVVANVAARSITPSGMSSAEVIGTAVVANATPQSVNSTGVGTAEAFGTTVIADVVLAVTPVGMSSGEVFGSLVASLSSTYTIAPAGIATAEALGSAVVAGVPGQTIVAEGLISASSVGTPTVAGPTLQGILPGGIDGAEAFGTLVITQPAQFIYVNGIASGVRFGATVLTGGVVDEDGDPFFIQVFQPLWLPLWQTVSRS